MSNDDQAEDPKEATTEHEREIGGVNYRSIPLKFEKAQPALLRLLRLVAPVLASGIAESGFGQPAMMGALLASLPGLLGDADVAYFSVLFGECSWYADGEKWVPLIKKPKDNQSVHFDGRLYFFFKWLVFNVEVSFASFFDGMKQEKGAAVWLSRMQSNLKGSTPGSGSSGESSPTTPKE